MYKKWIYPILSFVVLIILWEILTILYQVPIYVLPRPSQIGAALFTDWHNLFKHSLTTLLEAVIGLILAAILAFFIAILMDLSKGLKLAFYPHLVVSQTIPVLVLGPIFTIWFGFGITPKIMMVILMCFFPIIVAFVDGLAQVDIKKITLLETYGASKKQIYTTLKFPEAMPSFFSGLKIAATYCVSGAIVGEWLSASSGLGYYMIRAKNSFLLDKVFASIICIILLSLALNAIVSLIQKQLIKKRMIRRV